MSASQLLVKIEPLFIFPTAGASALFLLGGGADDSDQNGELEELEELEEVDEGEKKVALMFIDRGMGEAVINALNDVDREVLGTHDFFQRSIEGFGGKMRKMVITEERNGQFKAMGEFIVTNDTVHKSIVQVECRPSDALAMAVRMEAPMYCKAEVWERQIDRAEMLAYLEQNFKQSIAE